jgi:hypothetical protein
MCVSFTPGERTTFCSSLNVSSNLDSRNDVIMGSWKSTMFFSRPSESHSVTPTRSPSTSVSRYSEVKGESPEPTAVAGGDGVCGRFLAGSASAVRRNSMKDDFPQPLAPTTRMLHVVSVWKFALRICVTYLNGVGSFLLLTRRGLLTALCWLLA